MSNKFKIAGLQMVSGLHPAENLVAAGQLVAEAAAAGAQLALLPEYFPIISSNDADRFAVREPYGSGPIQDWLAATARQHGLWLVAGSIPLTASAADKVRNASLVFDPAGNCVGRYDKIHLFSFDNGAEHYDEAAYIEAGNQPVALEMPFGRMALSICYDLRFPELYRQMTPVELILVPAAFTETTGRDHWEILLRARAIENQCYVLAVGQGGEHPGGRQTHGNSMVIDPWGLVLDRRDKGSGIVLAEIDPERIRQVRANLPALNNRRFQ
ncbi:MAG: Nitrilase/cyanide hydratase and apolipoprotein N-acyltransferase [Proteobacteria bacterium]|nr:Nitrilase/cyanide hydratase and apolipoprotein N-acyltransferase [Pseudomonadota bacterium]